MSSTANPQTDRLRSQLLEQEPDLRSVVEEFVVGLDARLQDMRRAFEGLDADGLATLAHRLKGAGGSYGYPDISRVCAEMEGKCRAHQIDEFEHWITQLAELSAAARAGLNPEPGVAER